jgi:sulfoxide reductase heme-binding subunit YedZ
LSPGTSSRDDYWRRRLARHAALAAVSVGLSLALTLLVPLGTPARRLALATGYVGLALMGLTLLIGPWYVWRGRRSPVSLDLRRDIGIWAALVSLVHTAVGLTVHMQGRFWLYFVWPPEAGRAIPVRTDAFGFANYTGLAATMVATLLLAISNDLALRRLGPERWKALQRWNYVGFTLVALHGVGYELMGRRPAVLGVALGFAAIVVGLSQLSAYRKRRAGRSP